MTRRWIWLALVGALVTLLGLGLSPARAAGPLQPQLTVSGLPPMQTTPDVALQPLKAMQPGPTDFAAPAALPLAQAASPRQVTALADPSNYGDRFATDINGQVLHNDFIAVIHETVGSAQSALNLFRTHHPRDQDQVSYHTLIGRDGTVYYIVPPEKRAFGAGNSVFNGPNGPETVRTNPAFPPSVNNFAYHISLETPGDGMNNRRSHSGYTQAQYASLAWLLAQTTIPDNRITTHQAVDRSGNRMDPRSFNGQGLFSLLRQYPTRSGLSG
ncbi:peptidoglycan recognition family protein [Nodosilinea sp. E11]|uniref:peptidoglycan recognition protein family protein n=1 Tax=Nodosilinea sp. E11 TaxID=3037479 RepID=UPI002934F411|nr:peptidoglycan recognition family protein [Nodosilinea sp. E11]WOD40399.1 peptidoglycan recognition family protein [Nodosilinea sp. E11]